jgi:hypothetical protein
VGGEVLPKRRVEITKRTERHTTDEENVSMRASKLWEKQEAAGTMSLWALLAKPLFLHSPEGSN